MADMANMAGGLLKKAADLFSSRLEKPEDEATKPQTADPYADKEAILALVKKRRDDWGQRGLREPWLRPMYRNLLYYLGVQWIRWERSTGRWRPANIPRDVPTPVTNVFADTMDAVMSVFGRIEPKLFYSPGNPDEPEDRAAADVANRVIEVVEKEVNIRMNRQSLATWVGLTGGAFLETGYDPDPVHGTREMAVDVCQGVTEAGSVCGHVQASGAPMCEGCGMVGMLKPSMQQVPVGKMFVQVRPLFECYFDPSVTDWSKHKRFLTEEAGAVEDAEAMWPEFKGQFVPNVVGTAEEWYMASLATQGPALDDRGTGRRDQFAPSLINNKITTRRYWQLPDATYPQGLLAIVVGQNTLVYAKPLPYTKRSAYGPPQPFLPFTWFPQNLVPGTLWPKTVAHDVALKQAQRNRWESALELCFMRMGMPIWLRPRGSNANNLTGTAGQIVDYNAMGPANAKPERIPGSPIPLAAIQFIELIDKAIEKLAKCLTGKTEIPCLDGKTRTMEELAREFPNGGMWVYGFDPKTQMIVPSLVEKAWNTGRKTCVRVAFKEGTAVECSFDHPFLTWDRGYVKACDLVAGDSIVPLKLGRNYNDYPTVYQPALRKSEPVHRMVAAGVYGLERGSGKPTHVHHEDHTRDNNLPANLMVTSDSGHLAIHWERITESQRRRRLDPMHAAMRHYWDSLSLEEKTRRNLAAAQNVSPEANKRRIRAAVAGQKNMSAETKEAKRERQRERMKAYWATRTPEQRQAQHQKMQNHEVFTVTPIGERDVYDLQTTTHNFGLAAGVITSNTFDVIKGSRPEGVSAGIALQILQERGMSAYGRLFIQWETSWAEWALQAIEIARQFWTEERLLQVKGKDGRWQVQKFAAADLQGRVDVAAEAGSSMPRSSLLDRAEMEQLAAMGVLNPRDPETAQKFLEVYGRTNLLPSMEADSKNAVMENEVFSQIGQWPGWQQATQDDINGLRDPALSYPMAVASMTEWAALRGAPSFPWPEVSAALDGHAIHSREHKTYGKSESYRALPKIVQAMFEKKVAYHDQLLIQQMAAIQGGGQIQGGFMQPAPGGAMPKEQTLNTSSSPDRLAGDYSEMERDQVAGMGA